MPVITIQQSPRTTELKRELVEKITQAFVDAYGLTPGQVHIFIHEVGDAEWGTHGMLACDRRG